MRNILFHGLLLFLFSLYGNADLTFAQLRDFPWCVAHRGYSYLENSIAAVEAAIQAGADAIELDVRHSNDGHALVHHDSRLKRTSKNRKGKSCRLHTPISSQEFATIRDNCVLKNDEELPSLEAMLGYFVGLDQVLIIEFKDSPSKETLDTMRKFQDKSINLVAVSFEQKILDTLARLDLVFQEPIKLIWLTPIPVYLPQRFDGIGPYIISDGMIAHLRQNQKFIDIWTVDRPRKMKSLFSKGVHMITTNRIETCLNVKSRIKPSSRKS
ncbi:MAG: glycerophosphodiester phosphodiesterase [Oligoflexales bacterium]